MPYGHLTHKLDAHGVCVECGCPQYGAQATGYSCPLTDEQYAKIWQLQLDPLWIEATKPTCDEARKEYTAKLKKAPAPGRKKK